MARSKASLIGHLHGIGMDGAPAVVSVYKAGREYRISHGDRDHLCHPSVRSIPNVKTEALLVFHVRDGQYTAL
jgi:hypothetical protein